LLNHQQKKEELQSRPFGELAQQSKAAGASGKMSKEARVELLLTRWQAQGGIEQGLAQMAKDAREAALLATDSAELRSLCESRGLDALVQEVMVDRLLRREAALGRFAPPAPAEEEARAPEPEGKGDLVSTLLANEAARAKRRAEEARQQEREAQAAKQRDELRSATVAELRKRLASRGAATGGTKDELVEAVFAQEAEDAAAAQRKASLRELGKDGLKELLASKGLKASGVNEMVDALLQHDAKREEERRAYEAQVLERLKQKKDELEAKTGAELKELCAARGLGAGASNEDRVQRLLRAAREDGDIDRAISLAARAARRKDLEAMDRAALLELCGELEVDPLVKSVLVERLLEHEAEAGHFAAKSE